MIYILISMDDSWNISSFRDITDDVAKIFLYLSPGACLYVSLLGIHLRVAFLGREHAHIQLWQQLLTVFLMVGPVDTPTSSVSGSQGPLISANGGSVRGPL